MLITGASSGLGETLAHEFYSHGCALILTGRSSNELERVKNDLLSRSDVNEKFYYFNIFYFLFSNLIILID